MANRTETAGNSNDAVQATVTERTTDSATERAAGDVGSGTVDGAHEAVAKDRAGHPIADTSSLARPLISTLRLSWEAVAWITLLVVSTIARFVDLGERAMSHDESLHALYSYYLYSNGNYVHDPMMHGPFLFHTNALIYFLFGDSDTTARIVPALFGIGVIAFAFALRRYIGRTGAFAAALMLSISPSMLFHSRYIRNDIYIALFTMVWVYGAFRYMDARNMQRIKWLWLMLLGMAWGFIAKENHFMHGALLGIFFVALALWQVIGQRALYALGPLVVSIGIAYPVHVADQDLIAAAIVLVGVIAAAAITFSSFAQDGWARLRRSDAGDIAVVMATVIAPFTAPFLHEVLAWDPLATQTTEDLLRSATLVLLTTGLGVAVAYFWFGMRSQRQSLSGAPLMGFGDWARMMGVFWLIQVLFFTTFLTNTRGGLASGIVGSLGYWLSQQEVARGGQPWYYYTMQSLLYEFLPLVLSVAGGIGLCVALWRMRRGRKASAAMRKTEEAPRKDDRRVANSLERWEPVPVHDLPDSVRTTAGGVKSGVNGDENGDEAGYELLRQNRVIFAVLGAWWVVGSWLAYTIAGEKMPWLLVHIATPMCIFGGWWLGQLIQSTDWEQAYRRGVIWLLGATPGLLLVGFALFRAWPEAGRSLAAQANTMQAIVAFGVLAALVWFIWRAWQASGRRIALRLLAMGGLAVLLAFTVRFTYMLNYINFDYATEYLVYAHGTPDIKRALNEIDLISERTVGERDIVVAYDDNSAWPLSWYMRLYPNSRFYGSNPTTEAMQAPVIIVGPRNYESVHPYVSRDYVKRTYRLVWWPDQGYFNLTAERLFATLTDWDRMRNIYDIVMYRRYASDLDPNRERSLTEWPNRHEFELHVRRDIAADIWDLELLPGVTLQDPLEAAAQERETEVDASQVYDAVYGDSALVTPRSVAVGPAGERVIADTGNHRIVVLDRTGEFVRAFGSFCQLSEGEAGGCSTEFGSELGDGQFYEPWGVAVDDAGRIFVADTWNGRIQVFDANGEFLTKWGYFGSAGPELSDPLALFGPRGLALDNQGNVVVADTGNKRIIQYTDDGEFLAQIGGGGVVAGRFEEPTDVEIDGQTGFLFVADAWNRRVQVFSADLEPLADWPVAGWHSQQIYHKPFLTRAPNGDIYLTDPAEFRVIVLSPMGEVKASFGRYGTEFNRFGLPTGITYDPVTELILVADADNDRVMAFAPLP